jgi:hypothetical protein
LKSFTFHKCDDLQRKLTETGNYGSFSKTIGYSYYSNGLKKSFTYPGGTTIDYAYDQNNRLRRRDRDVVKFFK